VKAVVCPRLGEPGEVLELRDVPGPTCGPGQVRVRMLASPVNPSDLFMIRGRYGHQPAPPFTPGMEGVGVVEEGKGLLAWRVKGRRVAVLNGAAGNWAEQVVIPARQAVPVPDDLTDGQAATFFVNPASAVAMTRYVLAVPRGAWLLQTAAGSALGRMVIRLGKKHGFRTVNVVRRADQADELLRLGADVVLDSTRDDIAERVTRLTGTGVGFVLDAVGGVVGSRCVNALGPGGRFLSYSSLSGEPISFDPRVLMTRGCRIEGFWLSQWARRQGPLRMLGLFRRIAALLREGVVSSDIGAELPLAEVREAVLLAETPARTGKVLLRIGSR
jgi:NADPH:quinone reductase-like Zn-dependent oxidoreductase